MGTGRSGGSAASAAASLNADGPAGGSASMPPPSLLPSCALAPRFMAAGRRAARSCRGGPVGSWAWGRRCGSGWGRRAVVESMGRCGVAAGRYNAEESAAELHEPPAMTASAPPRNLPIQRSLLPFQFNCQGSQATAAAPNLALFECTPQAWRTLSGPCSSLLLAWQQRPCHRPRLQPWSGRPGSFQTLFCRRRALERR